MVHKCTYGDQNKCISMVLCVIFRIRLLLRLCWNLGGNFRKRNVSRIIISWGNGGIQYLLFFKGIHFFEKCLVCNDDGVEKCVFPWGSVFGYLRKCGSEKKNIFWFLHHYVEVFETYRLCVRKRMWRPLLHDSRFCILFCRRL